MFKHSFTICCALIMASCGGGGGADEIAIPQTSISNLLDTWTNLAPDPDCALTTLADNSQRRVKEGSMRVTKGTSTNHFQSQYIETIFLYEANDVTCHTPTGVEEHTFDLTWSAPTSSLTKEGAVRFQINGYTIKAYGDYTQSTTFIAANYKGLFYLNDGVLNSYFDVATSNLDSEGYPLGTDAPLFSYQRGGLWFSE